MQEIVLNLIKVEDMWIKGSHMDSIIVNIEEVEVVDDQDLDQD